MPKKELIKVTMTVTMDLRKAMMKAQGLSRIQTYEKGGKLTVTLYFNKNRDLPKVDEVIKEESAEVSRKQVQYALAIQKA